VELHPIDYLREPFEPAQSSPAALGAQAELVEIIASIPSRVRHPFVRSVRWRTVAKLDSITFELRMWIILAP
jgi:hypothetical protein